MMTLLQFAPIAFQVFGTAFVWFDTERISASIRPGRLILTDDPKWEKWRYNKSELGFTLLFIGILLQSVSIALTGGGLARVDYLASFLPVATFFLSVAVGIVAWQQWRVARNKLRLDLFDRRYQVYDATRRFVRVSVQDNAHIDRHLSAFSDETSNAEFLFDTDVVNYLEKIRQQAQKEGAAMWFSHPDRITETHFRRRGFLLLPHRSNSAASRSIAALNSLAQPRLLQPILSVAILSASATSAVRALTYSQSWPAGHGTRWPSITNSGQSQYRSG
jgi:hypothetical protein